jgi:hypothetical protein
MKKITYNTVTNPDDLALILKDFVALAEIQNKRIAALEKGLESLTTALNEDNIINYRFNSTILLNI